VFALLADTPSVTVLPQRDQTLRCNAYDIWCSGISSTCLAPVQLEDESTWKSLVEASCQWEDIYDDPDEVAKELRMAMTPGVSGFLEGLDDWNDNDVMLPLAA